MFPERGLCFDWSLAAQHPSHSLRYCSEGNGSMCNASSEMSPEYPPAVTVLTCMISPAKVKWVSPWSLMDQHGNKEELALVAALLSSCPVLLFVFQYPSSMGRTLDIHSCYHMWGSPFSPKAPQNQLDEVLSVYQYFWRHQKAPQNWLAGELWSHINLSATVTWGENANSRRPRHH